MKELSIEEKARRYDEAIKRLEDIETGKCQKTFMFTEGLFDYIFPELKESEDERIRKSLILLVKSVQMQTGYDGVLSIKYDDMITWLEKQAQKPNPCNGCINRKGCINCENGELRETEQKPAEWNEEDEKEVAVLEAYIRSKDWSESHIDRALCIVDELVNKVKSLRPQPQWKPSDEQMGVIEAVINNRSFQRRHLDSLYEQLKKLK